MANPQLEHGYTKITNKVMEHLSAAPLSGRQFRVLLVVMRKTWGWKKKRDRLSLGQVAKLTGIGRQHVSGIVAELVERRYLLRDIPENGKGMRTYQINKDYDAWDNPQSYAPGDKPFPKTGQGIPENGKGERGVRIPENGTHKRKKLYKRVRTPSKDGDKARNAALADRGFLRIGSLINPQTP